MTPHNPYTILDLPSPPHPVPLSAHTIRHAYRTALLTYHPDKANAPQPAASETCQRTALPAETVQRRGRGAPSVADIVAAYQTLSRPQSRAEVDRRLCLQPGVGSGAGVEEVGGGSSAEAVDLDDMRFDEQREVWCRACRCGRDMGYVVKMEDLEKAAADAGQSRTGEVLVGCGGCSLWIRVGFAVREDDGGTEQSSSTASQE